ncbi:FeoA family protein [Pelomonas sp. SE-A7]|uniref:FeoA family protein n=1 Tax=Pelomonas sp. SE-A7 TaxID=3054953 RepID=UPI00259CB1A3|nr:FeoA family protein [Pelomonas sp. SE-A7]MDM4765528.1 FeoA family protein [Pelomonas sp. SE-A7]
MPPPTLDQADIGAPLRVSKVQVPAEAPEWGPWLEQIGFVPGEPVRLMARAALGGDPLVVRIGHSTFALRRAEAACIEVATAA